MASLTRRSLLIGAGAAVGIAGTRYFSSRTPSQAGTASIKPSDTKGTLNDASGLSETPIHKHIMLSTPPDERLVATLRREIQEAQSEGRPVNAGAARHSMGGQAIPRDGHAVTFDNTFLELDTAGRSFSAHAGIRWAQVIAHLDPVNFSPLVMQSNNDFGIAATFCVNAHGWPVKHGPMGATVKSFRLLLADGELITCSRTENPEIFKMTMGGYGLSGIIIDLVVETAPNLRLEARFDNFPAREFGRRFVQALEDPAVNMAYARLNVDRDSFFDDAFLVTFRATADQSDLPPASGAGWMTEIARRMYRAQLGNEPVKGIRWFTETNIGPLAGTGSFTRNTLINEPVSALASDNPDYTDILHEYFVAPERFEDFLAICKEVIPASYQEFLNVTLRFVDTDPESLLSYAPVPRIAAVMSFAQEMTSRAEHDMKRMTQRLIDGITSIGGTYYLPYRPHARLDQFTAAYPRAAEFATLKRSIDPQSTFRNNLWDQYLGAL